MNNFITNSGTNNLKRRIIELLTKSEELKFLVGFFYFSGIRELYSGLKSNNAVKIKVLVGLDVDIINHKILELPTLDYQGSSDDEITHIFFQSIKKSINTDEFDTSELYEQIKFFINLIKKDRLIIRKTRSPNHAKLYIFKLGSGQVGRNSLFITGSSNLTRTGLIAQEEFNVEISDYGFNDAENYFDCLWEDSLPITEEDAIKTKLINVLEKETLIKEITPFEAFVLALKIYLDSFEKKYVSQTVIDTLEENGYKPYQYQLDAISQALSIIEKNNGVILADVVGLGKTVIACSIAKQLRKRGVIICPPGLMGDRKGKDSGWYMYKEQFGLYDWEVWSVGDLERLQNAMKTKYREMEVVIVDEAHRFRNQDTQNYEYLKNICRNKIVILLTATPFNNRPGDILSLLKLFIVPKKSNISLENDLAARFKSFKGEFERLGFIKKYWNSNDLQKRQKAEKYYQNLFGEEYLQESSIEKVNRRTKYLAKQIRNVIEPVTIRRNRLDLELNPHYKKEIQSLSKVADPIEWFFELTAKQSAFYDNVIKDYFSDPDEGGRFKGAIYRPFEYESQGGRREDKLTREENFELLQQRNLYDFMRRLLVKRFESSFGAFEQSIRNFERIMTTAKHFIDKTGKYILDRSLLERIYDKDPEEIELYLEEYSQRINQGQYPKNHKVYRIDKFIYKDEFLKDIESDIALFGEILRELHILKLTQEGNDPKSICIIEKLKEYLQKEPDRKIVIFSEYIDTVKYLKPILEKALPERVLTIFGNLTKSNIDAINKNFDASYPNQKNNYDILLATDKLSEGFNLNRAGMVVNYDIPWNPVRVIQRVGRINRISKKVFDELYIVNFFPTEQGAELVKSRQIAANKMYLIHNALGEDSKIFHVDETPSPAKLYERIIQNPDKMEEESFYTRALNEFEKIKQEYPDLIRSLENFPLRVKVAKQSDKNELFVFIKKNMLYIQKAFYNEENKIEIEPFPFEDVFDRILCDYEEGRVDFSENFWELYDRVKEFKGIRVPPNSEQSLEQRAINNLKTLIQKVNNPQLLELKPFLRMLLDDIKEYGTLPDYTLRRIANWGSLDEKKIAKIIDAIKSLRDELGESYLKEEIEKQRELKREIIVAIENRKM
ncbi:helicase-related protein [Desulfonauticus submarinus]